MDIKNGKYRNNRTNGNVTNQYLVYIILPPITKSLYDEKIIYYILYQKVLLIMVILKINLTDSNY